MSKTVKARRTKPKHYAEKKVRALNSQKQEVVDILKSIEDDEWKQIIATS